MTIPEQVDAYRALLDEKDRLADETKANNKAIEAAREQLASAMIEEENASDQPERLFLHPDA